MICLLFECVKLFVGCVSSLPSMIHRWARLHYGTNVAVLGRQNTPPKDRAFVQMPCSRNHRLACCQGYEII